MPVSLEQFIERLVQSGLYTAQDLSAFQEGLPPEKRPKDPQGLARELIQAGRLTKFQAEAVYVGKTKGLVLGDYVILDKIGAGGMGEVLRDASGNTRHGRIAGTKWVKVQREDGRR